MLARRRPALPWPPPPRPRARPAGQRRPRSRPGAREPSSAGYHRASRCPTCAQRSADVAGVTAHALGLPADLRLDLLLGGAHALDGGDRLQHELGFYRTLRLGAEVGLELLGARLRAVHVLVERDAHHAELLGETACAVLQLLVDQRLGQWHVDLAEIGLQHSGLQLGADLAGGGLGEALAQVGLELVERVELARLLGEVVVQGRQDLGLGLLDQHREGDLLAGELPRRLRQGVVEAQDVALARAVELLVELWHHRSGADLVEEIGPRQLCDLLGVARRSQVDLRVVALGDGTADHLELGEALAELVQLRVDVLIGHVELWPLDLDAAVGREVDLGLDLHRGGELQRLAVGVVGRLDLAAGERLDAELLQRPGVELRHRLVLDRLGDQGLPADAGLQHRAGHLALAEPGHLHLAAQAPRGPLDRRAKLAGIDHDVDLDLRRLDGLKGAAHGFPPEREYLNRAASGSYLARRATARPPHAFARGFRGRHQAGASIRARVGPPRLAKGRASGRSAAVARGERARRQPPAWACMGPGGGPRTAALAPSRPRARPGLLGGGRQRGGRGPRRGGGAWRGAVLTTRGRGRAGARRGTALPLGGRRRLVLLAGRLLVARAAQRGAHRGLRIALVAASDRGGERLVDRRLDAGDDADGDGEHQQRRRADRQPAGRRAAKPAALG